MQTLQHTIEINAHRATVFAFCLEIEKWPRYFEPCKAARVIAFKGNRQTIEITALADQQLLTWRSERVLDRHNRIIHFHQSKPAQLFETMTGSWRFFSTKAGTLVSLEHSFEPKEKTIAAERKAAIIIDQNSQKELLAMKNSIENGPPMSNTYSDDILSLQFHDTLNLQASGDAVFQLLKHIQQWPTILPHCQHVECLYDDGTYQEIIMTVNTPHGNENIRTVRICRNPCHIDYFQPDPPPILTKHTGCWSIEEKASEISVTSSHTITVNPEKITAYFGEISAQEALQKIKVAIQQNSLHTLHAIANTLCHTTGELS